ncbi:hypothetical protein A2U01_0072509, partial [Trifolium medium]|nr:hypothetical protein [Trifolium medium]
PPRDDHRHSPWSDEERHIGPLTRRVMRVPLPVGLEKPPPLDTYDGSTDRDDHIENIKVVLDYRDVQGSIKCKLFPTTLRKGAMSWYKNLPPESIDSWRE